MTREEAIKKIKWFREYNEDDFGDGDRIQDKFGDWYYLVTEQDLEAFDMAIKALEQEPRWIPTSERYPKIEDEYKYFLVTDEKGKVSIQEFFISLDEEPQPYFSGMVNVIAWMPLPQAYREVEV